VRTAHPGPTVFAEVIERAGDDDLVAVHLSSALSGTYSAATAAVGDRGEVVDSRTCGMAMGFVVLAAARAAAAGKSVEQVAEAARAAMRRTNVWFFVESLEALRRGGRIGTASALLGSALSMKPLLYMVDGAVEPLEKVRTSSRAIARLQALAAEKAGRGSVDVAVMHLAAEARATALGESLRSALPAVGELHVTELSATVGAHTGLGALGLAITERR
jgi:DegV family protein with EDD domain